ncbi:MAG: O-antigen ligase family protein [Campylobacterota bacterium]|nr:O-antigen ligase family protein [Campylobacterota bacterium]
MFLISFSVISFNMIVGALGYGYAQYGRNDIGTRGLFYAGNEVGGLLITTSIFVLSYFLLKKEFYKYLSISLIILTLAVLLTSKVALFGSALIIFILPIINLISTSKGLILNRTSFHIVGVSTLIFVLLVPYTIYYALYEMNLIVRISYWMNKVDLITLFYSGRNLLANDIFQFLQNQDISFSTFFGYGYEKIITVAGRSVELDAVDLFMLYGIIGVVIIYGFFLLNYFSNRIKKSKVYIYKPYVQFGILFLLLISISSGHIINSGVAGIMIGALMSLNYYKVGNK